MERTNPYTSYLFSFIIAILGAITSIWGLTQQLIYQGNSGYQLPQILSQDLITLVIGVPLLLVTTCMAMNKSARGYLIWLGTLGYFLYTYFNYTCGLAYNNFFPVYLVLFSLSLFALIRGLVALDTETLSLRFTADTPVKYTASYLSIYGLLLAWSWIGKLYPALIAGKIPQLLKLYGTTTLIGPVFDLVIISPLAVVTGVWLWKRKPWGFALTALLLLKCLLMGLTALATEWVVSPKTPPTTLNVTFLFGAVTFFTSLFLVLFLKNLREETMNSYRNRRVTRV